MNPFQNTYHCRLREWKNLRHSIQSKSLLDACIEVDRWWQQAPLINHHLHPQDASSWPNPWTILSDNTYCTLTRGIGICYTLMMCEIQPVKLVQAINQTCEEHNLVIVGGAKYVLNYYPGTVLSTNLNEFNITRELSLDPLSEQLK